MPNKEVIFFSGYGYNGCPWISRRTRSHMNYLTGKCICLIVWKAFVPLRLDWFRDI